MILGRLLVQIENLGRGVDNPFTDRQGGRGRRRRRINHMDASGSLFYDKVIEEIALLRHRLCAYTCAPRLEVRRLYVWHETLKGVNESSFPSRAIELLKARLPVF